MTANQPRILIAEDYGPIADVYRRRLQTEFDVVGVVSDGRGLIRSAVRLKPDVILADIAMPGLNGLEACRQVKQKFPRIKVVFLTMDLNSEIAAEALNLGASAYLTKDSASSELEIALWEVLQGKTYISSTLDKHTLHCRRWERKRRSFTNAEVRNCLSPGEVAVRSGTTMGTTPS
ncbi:MAG TPA: response regulator transcription factor [Terriglobales bacterium]|nr:response regulator transcription factor [Terriglobales bacterium]